MLTEVKNLQTLINYQDQAVVSRTLVKKEAGTITLFAFDKGQGLSEHRAPFDAVVYLIEGEAEVSVSGKVHPMKSGNILIMPANEPHALKAIEKFKMLLTMLRS